ncbi:gp44 [Rhodococcus phage ReqiPine5]|uniref:Gp44 n=1 Tax=Rhodococcus phage ReqiPine5 TaxID=691963 RepID=D4P819_9CAUD|nr:gp44 [Rhodococcus phage ReqiPine5]ADD81149.1 gp44 [Rhodococcus phage ReqiPine5]
MPVRYVITTQDDVVVVPEKFSVISTDPTGGGVAGLSMTPIPTYFPTEWIDPQDLHKCDLEDLVGWRVQFYKLDDPADEHLYCSAPITSITKEVFQ